MSKEVEKMNIYEKLSAITTEIGAVAKNLSVGFGKNQYKAVGEADVLAAVKPAEEKYRVYSYPFSRRVIESGTMESVGYDGKVKKNLWLRVETVYRFVNIDKPDEHIDITSYGDGVDPQDKAPGKAVTYSDKYSLLKAYKVMTGEDPDQNMSEELKNTTSKTSMASKAQVETIKELTTKVPDSVGLQSIKKQLAAGLTAEQAGVILAWFKKNYPQVSV